MTGRAYEVADRRELLSGLARPRLLPMVAFSLERLTVRPG